MAAIALAAALAGMLVLLKGDPVVVEHPITKAGHTLVRVDFSDLPGFSSDNIDAAFETFLRSCEKGDNDGSLANACLMALAARSDRQPGRIHDFFTDTFQPYRIEPKTGKGLVTAYYEPVVAGSRTPTSRFATPLFPLPDDFVQITEANKPKKWDEDLSWGRQSGQSIVPAPTRAEIDDGALADAISPLIYVENPVEAFYIHIQGSTRVVLPDGSKVRIGFAGKNGHPYSSVGRVMQKRGIKPPGGFSMDGMRAFFGDNPDLARELMQENHSFIFFREIPDLAAELGPIGGEGIPLTAGRSIAVDTDYHHYGTPIFIDAMPQIGSNRAPSLFQHLMIAQDTGSAIQGPARADLFWGTGDNAGSMAGGIKASGTFYVLLPKS